MAERDLILWGWVLGCALGTVGWGYLAIDSVRRWFYLAAGSRNGVSKLLSRSRIEMDSTVFAVFVVFLLVGLQSQRGLWLRWIAYELVVMVALLGLLGAGQWRRRKQIDALVAEE